jgi:hypothetical protein
MLANVGTRENRGGDMEAAVSMSVHVALMEYCKHLSRAKMDELSDEYAAQFVRSYELQRWVNDCQN